MLYKQAKTLVVLIMAVLALPLFSMSEENPAPADEKTQTETAAIKVIGSVDELNEDDYSVVIQKKTVYFPPALYIKTKIKKGSPLDITAEEKDGSLYAVECIKIFHDEEWPDKDVFGAPPPHVFTGGPVTTTTTIFSADKKDSGTASKK